MNLIVKLKIGGDNSESQPYCVEYKTKGYLTDMTG
jgi:hypothetical protein